MPPFSKFRGHRRTSTPTSPDPASLHTLESPVQLSGLLDRSSFSSESPFDTTFPSPRPYGSSFESQSNGGAPLRPGSDAALFPRFSGDEAQNIKRGAYFDQQRPASSSAAASSIGGSSSPGPSFGPPQRVRNALLTEHGPPLAPSMAEQSSFREYSGGRMYNNPTGFPNERGLVDDLDAGRASSKAGKGRLNLLNPMSLLARRRSSQAIAQKNDEPPMTVSTLPVPAMPDDYDPRIRGNIVHDFSAPRPRRQQSSEGGPNSAMNRKPAAQPYEFRGLSPVRNERQNVKSPEKVPLFKEHFDDDRPVLQPESKGYLHSLVAASSIPHPSHEPPAIPAFARALPARLPDAEEIPRRHLPSLPESQTPPGPRSPPKSPPQTVIRKSPSQTIRLPSGEVTIQASALPKHMTSNASRFSFDLSGVGSSAQEKLLEEKHKQKQAARKADFRDIDADAEELDDYANYSFEDFDDDLEEKIPGVNVDAEEEEEGPKMRVNSGLQHFHFTPSIPSTIMSPATLGSGQTSFPTPRDDQGQAIGYALSKESPDARQQSPPYYQITHPSIPSDLVHGLGISSMAHGLAEQKSAANGPPAQTFSEEDMYFDDGDIQLGADDSDLASFDESIFDNEAGGIPDIPAQNARKLEAVRARPSQNMATGQTDSAHTSFDQNMVDTAAPLDQTIPGKELKGLTEDNMAAFQKALISAAAAQDAVATEQLDHSRSASQSQMSNEQLAPPQDEISPSRSILESTDLSRDIEDFDADDGPNPFNFDDDEDDGMDDQMIAAANAEALENDDEGFYGREFGFYARTTTKENLEMVNGGYFVPKGMEGVHRSHSGRADFQEPSLTPITERSEWSARNSMASIHAFGIPPSAHSLPSPAIVDLIGQGSFEDEMSLGALMRLRRGAWGGSQTSLQSSAGSQTSNNSPVNIHTSPRDLASNPPPISIDAPAHMSGSAFSLNGSIGIPESEEEDEDDFTASPTVTQNTPQKLPHHHHTSANPSSPSPPLPFKPPPANLPFPSLTIPPPQPSSTFISPPPPPPSSATQQQQQLSSPSSASLLQSPSLERVAAPAPQRSSHSRNNSAASGPNESVSYVKDPEAPGRYIVERKRTLDSGEIELIGREVLVGNI